MFPHAQSAVQIGRRRLATNQRWHSETVYAVTDLSWQQVRADQFAEAVREHWRAHNLLRAAATLASRRHGKARGATLRRELINVPARLAHRGRDQLILHLPGRESGAAVDKISSHLDAVLQTCSRQAAHPAIIDHEKIN